MKLFADINVSVRVVAALRARGHDIVRVDSCLPPTASDIEIAAFARAQEGVIVSRDQDFSAIVALSGASGPSIVNLRHTRTEAAFLSELLDRALRLYEAHLAAGAIVTIDDRGVRVHALPIGREH
ncbi:MAG: DUF5615 family PIN-like protein [Deltaproteobacteria bacterium]|nr:DUF5615 family PIN-like protein [Deltaproteobacteria bacterium]